MARICTDHVRERRTAVELLSSRLEGLNPLAVLARGYAVVRDVEGNSYSDAAKLTVGQRVRIVLRDGAADATVDTIWPKERG